MFIQQAFRVLAVPLTTQQQPTRLDSAIRMHYAAKAKTFETEVVKIHRIDVINPILVQDHTQAEILLSVEADTVSFFNAFTQSFFVDEETESMKIQIIR